MGGAGVGLPPHADITTPSRTAATARAMPGVIADKTPAPGVRFRSSFIRLDLYKCIVVDWHSCTHSTSSGIPFDAGSSNCSLTARSPRVRSRRSSRRSSGSRSRPCRSTSGSSGTAGSRRFGHTARADCTRSMPLHSGTSTPGSSRSGGSGTSASTRWRQSLPVTSASVAGRPPITTRPPKGKERHDRHCP